MASWEPQTDTDVAPSGPADRVEARPPSGAGVSPETRRRGRPPGVDIRPGSVREARTEAVLSLAKVAGGELSAMAIHHIEAGRCRQSIATLELVAARTGQPRSFFLGDSESASTPNPTGPGRRRARTRGSSGD